MADASALLELTASALELWRGDPCSGIPDAEWMPPVRAQLTSLRLDLADRRVQALLDTGQPERAATELIPLIAEHPFGEHLWALRMLALYRSRHQAAALEAFAEARRLLLDELGVEPGAELRRLHRQLLDQSGSLDGPRDGRPADLRAPASVAGLPIRHAGMVGRSAEIGELIGMLGHHRLVTLLGPGGAGKTRLAVEVAHRANDGSFDRISFVDLSQLAVGANEERVLDALAAAVEPALPPGTPVREAVIEHLSHGRSLVLLDNCEHVTDAAAAIAEDMLDKLPALVVLATSRVPLTVAGEREYPVEPLPDQDAAELFAERLSNLRPDLDPAGADRDVVVEICTLVGALPLGIELAAARARVFELAEIADSLASGPSRLERQGRGPARQSSMHETVDWSYRLARPAEQLLHRRLACLPGPVTFEAIRETCLAPPIDREDASDLLSGLVHQSLVTVVRPTRPHGPSTFRQLVPTRAHALGLLTPQEHSAADEARDRWVIERIRDAPLVGRPGQAEASQWVDDNMTTIRATLTSTLITAPRPVGFELLARLTLYWFERGRLIDARQWFEAALAMDARGELSGVDRAIVPALAGCAYALMRDGRAAQNLILPQLPALMHPPADRTDAVVEVLLLIATASWVCQLPETGLPAAAAAISITDRRDERSQRLRAHALHGAHLLSRGRGAEAIDEFAAVLADPAPANEFAVFVAAYGRSHAARRADDPVAAWEYMLRAIEAHRIMAMYPSTELLEDIAYLLDGIGAADEAVRALGAAAALHARDGVPWPRQRASGPLIESLRSGITAGGFDQLWASGERLARSDAVGLLGQWGGITVPVAG